MGDFDQSGTTDGFDFLMWQRGFGQTFDHPTGEYWLEVPPGEVTIREIVPLGFEQTFPFEQDHSLFLAPGEVITGINFGNQPLEGSFGSIHGIKWDDQSADGIRNTNEMGLAGVEIYLDLNNNGQHDPNEPLTVTAADDPMTQELNETGAYWFTGLDQGNYVVREIVPGDAEQIYPLSGFHAVRLGHNERIEGVDFGNWVSPDPTGGDGDNDGDVDQNDLFLWQEGFGRQFTLPGLGNFNGDTVTNGADFLLWQRGFGTNSTLPSVAAGTAPSGLVALWDFEQNLNDTAGAYVENVGAFSDDLTAVPTPPGAFYAPGLVGSSAVELVAAEKLTTTATGDLSLVEFTFELFVFPEQGLAGFGTIARTVDQNIPASTTDFRLSTFSGAVRLEILMGGAIQSSTSLYSLAPNVWSHLAVVAQATGELQLYIDGVFAESILAPGSLVGIDATDFIEFGGREFAGLIDKAAIWDVPLTDIEIQDHAQNPQDCYGLTNVSSEEISIHGHKFEDIDGDGLWDTSTEPPLADWEIQLSIVGGPSQSTFTNAQGEYWFTGLPLFGTTAIVSEVQQTNWLQTTEGGTGANGLLTPTPGTTDWMIDLAPLEQYFNVDFGNQRDIPPTPLPDGDDTIYASAGDDVEVYGDNLVSNPLIFSVGSRRDTIYGQAGNDYLRGQEEDDILWGADEMLGVVGSGDDDVVDGGLGIDEIRQTVNSHQTLTNTLLTGQGSDQLISIERAILTGGDSNNTLDAIAFTGPTRLFGEGGDDMLFGGANDDELDGGTGDDKLVGNDGDDRYVFAPVTGSSETDTVVELPSEGTDTLDFSSLDTSITVDLSVGLPGSFPGTRIAEQPGLVRVINVMNAGQKADLENIIGTEFGDTLTGNSAANQILALAGADSVAGGAGNDYIDMGTGTGETADGGADDDLFVFADGWGTVTQLTGGGGIDTVDFSAVTTKLLFEVGSLEVSTGANTVDNLAGDVEHLIGGLADDTFRFVTNGSSLPAGGTIDGRAGNDWLDYIGYTTSAADVDLSLGTAAGTSQVFNIENVLGGSAVDVIKGDSNANELHGRGGGDTITGLAGNDLLVGGPGADTLDGGGGSDVYLVIESDGNDNLSDTGPASDVDVLDLSEATTNLRVNVHATQVTVDFLTNGDQLTSTNTLESILTGDGDDQVLLFANATLPAGSFVQAGKGTDTLDYTNYNTGVRVNLSNQDHLTPLILANSATGIAQVDGFENVVGTNQNDLILGNDSDNRLSGLAGDDKLYGLRGKDTLLSGPGADESYGGNDDDYYIVDPAFVSINAIEYRGQATAGQASSGGVDTIDFSAVTIPITLDLNTDLNFENVIGSLTQRNELTGNFKDNLLIGGNASDKILGGGGDDILAGLGFPDWLEGGDGDDVVLGGTDADGTGLDSGNPRLFTGGPGRDILVGGTGPDVIDAADGEQDIVIGGTTAYDDVNYDDVKNFLLNRVAWDAIRDIWQSTNRNQALRMTLIENGVGTVNSGGPFQLLDGTTVFDDNIVDTFSIDDSAVSGVIDDWVFKGSGEPLSASLASNLAASSTTNANPESKLSAITGMQELFWRNSYWPRRREQLVEIDVFFQEYNSLPLLETPLTDEALREFGKPRHLLATSEHQLLEDTEEQDTLDFVFSTL